MNREEAFKEIDELQEYYVNQLIDYISVNDAMKSINFTSPTGTGKTRMMCKLINKLPNYYFIVTTLSKGQLDKQIYNELNKLCKYDNYILYGNATFRTNSVLKSSDVLNNIPKNMKCIWLRDEGHIKTNMFSKTLEGICYKIVNFSATNKYSDIKCNFSQTMMLRVVNQQSGTPFDAIKQLLRVKHIHRGIDRYNPCAIFRCIENNDVYNEITELCYKYNLRYIDISKVSFNMQELCKDDNEYDVIINKYKLVEGIDIRRAHVIYMDTQPLSTSTTIQAIGRCRRNALLYRDDVDIFSVENRKLLENTRQCYVYYNVRGMHIDEDIYGELSYAFCSSISCQELNSDRYIEVEDGKLYNGLEIIELSGCSGKYLVCKEKDTNFNFISPITSFYENEIYYYDNDYIYCETVKKRISKDNLKYLPKRDGIIHLVQNDRYYNFNCKLEDGVLDLYKELSKKFDFNYLYDKVKISCIDYLMEQYEDYNIKYMSTYISNFIMNCSAKKGYKTILNCISSIYDFYIKDEMVLSDLCSNEEITMLKYFICKGKVEGTINIDNLSDNICKYISARLIMPKGYDPNRYTYIILSKNFNKVNFGMNMGMSIKVNYDEEFIVSKEYIKYWFVKLDEYLDTIAATSLYMNCKELITSILNELNKVYNNLLNNKVDLIECDYTSLYEEYTNKDIENYRCKKVDSEYIESASINKYKSFIKIYNDAKSALIGTDLMKQIRVKDETVWIESKAVTTKIRGYNKLNTFISNKYKEELEQAKLGYFSGNNNFKLNKRCNSMLGYLVEYYSKYLVYGDEYLDGYLHEVDTEFKKKSLSSNREKDFIIIRACMLKYKNMMKLCYGNGVSKIIKGVSLEKLVTEDYNYFVDLVIELANKVAVYVNNNLYNNKKAVDCINPDLSIKHISGLADYITEDTILDVKVTNNINEYFVRQLLAYHYLSTKRSDLHIKRVIIFDATSGKDLVINIKECNIKK